MEFPASAIAIPISIGFAIILYRMIFVGEDESRVGREVKKEPQEEPNQQLLKSEKAEQIAAEWKITRVKRSARKAPLLRIYASLSAVLVTLIRLPRLPIVQYKRRRLEAERVKQEALVRRQQEAAEQRQQEIERAAQVAAERQRRSAERARKAALLAQQRKQQQYWESLGGIEFERELGKLFRARGYLVEFTPVSGDQGIDLILRKNDKTTVVQCKAQKRPASPNVIRDLYGSMLHHKADNAILACTGGFSGNVVKFARGKPIELISAWHIARMAEESTGETQEMSEAPPVCPNHGCGRTMVLRDGRYGEFWGCPRYPICRGTRQI